MNEAQQETGNMSDVEMQFDAVMKFGASIADINGVSKDTLDGIYKYAYDFYEKGRLDDAELFFKFLCIYDFRNADYLKGYAAVCQLKKEYQRAYDLYAVSFTLDPSPDYSTVYYMGLCQLGLQNQKMAIECFEMVVDATPDDELKAKANVYIELLTSSNSEQQEPEETP